MIEEFSSKNSKPILLKLLKKIQKRFFISFPFKTFMSVEIVCGKCGEKISNMKMLKSLKDVVKPYNGKCPSCGQALSTSEFTLDVQET